MFRAGGRYSAEALNDFEGFQKEFPAVSASRRISDGGLTNLSL